MKYRANAILGKYDASLPVRGAWIEIPVAGENQRDLLGRSPCGERGLKSFAAALVRRRPSGRSPCGERGLKSFAAALVRRRPSVAPRAGSVD